MIEKGQKFKEANEGEHIPLSDSVSQDFILAGGRSGEKGKRRSVFSRRYVHEEGLAQELYTSPEVAHS